MTKKITLTFFGVILTLFTYGQSYFGIKAGMNATKLTSSQSKAQFGFLGGITLDKPINYNLSFYPGILFSFNRFRSSDNYRPSYSLKSYSLEAPILLSVKFGDSPTQVAIDFGPYVRYGLFGKTYANNQKSNTFDDVKRFDIGGQDWTSYYHE